MSKEKRVYFGLQFIEVVIHSQLAPKLGGRVNRSMAEEKQSMAGEARGSKEGASLSLFIPFRFQAYWLLPLTPRAGLSSSVILSPIVIQTKLAD